MNPSRAEPANAPDTRAFVREECPHLSDLEWSALQRMASSVGEPAVAAVLHSLSHDEQHASITQFMHRELVIAQERIARLEEQHALQSEQSQQQITALREHSAQQAHMFERQQHAMAVAAAERPRRFETLKVEVSKYKGVDSDSLPRWFVELDDAIAARRIEDDSMRTMFALSNLAGRAKTWALGLKLRDPHCFRSFEEFKRKLREAFEPPKSEFRARAEFLELKQGKRDIHAYAQHARYLVSCVVNNPIDDQTQVVTYMKGLMDGPIKTHLFREYPETMEEAITVSLQEAFSLKQAHIHSSSYRPPRKEAGGGPEPMDLSALYGSQNSKSSKTCNRCKKQGHFAYECLAPRPAQHNAGGANRKPRQGKGARAGDKYQRGDQPKNGQGQ